MKIKKVTKNTAANLMSRLWSMIVTFLFVPLYIRYLGEEAYGMVSFYATLQATLNLLGLGLSSTLRREFSTGDDSLECRRNKYLLLRSVESVYLIIAVTIVGICLLGSSYIAESWLNLAGISVREASSVISIMGITIALQLVVNLYFGCLLGLGRQVSANKYYLIWNFTRNIGALGIIIFISPNLVLFYGWYAFCDAFYLIWTRYISIKLLELERRLKKWKLRDLKNLGTIWRYAFGLVLISCISVLSRQMDKAIISKLLPLAELGAYNTAVTLGQLTAIIPGAVSIAVMTEFTRLYSAGDEDQLKQQYRSWLGRTSCITIAMGGFISVYAAELLQVWTQSSDIVNIISGPAMAIVIGTTMLSLQEIPYAFLLAHGKTKINVIMGSLTIPVMAYCSWFFINRWGIRGAGIVYCAVMSIQTLVYLYTVQIRYFRSYTLNYIFHDAGIPLLVSFLGAFGSKYVCDRMIHNLYFKCAYAVICGFILFVIMYFAMYYKKKKSVSG